MKLGKGKKSKDAPNLTADDGDKSKTKKKRSYLRYYIGVPVFLVLSVIMIGLMPIQGTMQFGICKVFIEKRYTYPGTLDVISVLERPMDVRIEYTIMNEFGDTMFHTITCVFQTDPATGLVTLINAILDRRKIDPEELAVFNKAIPAIMAYPPDLSVPFPLTDDLMSLWKEGQR